MQRTFNVSVKSTDNPWPAWNSVAKNVESFVSEIAARLVVDADEVSDTTIASDKVPGAGDRTKIWIKTSWPFGIGVLIEGQYQMDYGMSQYPVRIPFLKLESEMTTLRDRVRKLSTEEIEAFGLPKLQTGTDVTNPVAYYIFEPNPISY